VYYPDAKLGTTGTTHRLSIGAAGHTCTIMRAELVALLDFLQQTRGNAKWTGVATDSLSGMHLILAAITRPHDLRDNVHEDLLRAIRNELRMREEPVHIYKVKSHSGIIGNEMADIGAKQAGVRADRDVAVGAETHRPGFWPTAVRPPADASEQRGATYVPRNLGSDLKRLCHSAHKMGGADTAGVYYCAWQRAKQELDHMISNAFLTSARVGHTARRLAIQYRSGGLYTQKLAFRYGHAQHSNCVLCGEPDGAGHALSGCRAMERLVTERHNGLARILAKAILQGRQGASVVMADVGRRERLEADGIHGGRACTRVPKELLPSRMTGAQRATAKRGKPDLLLVQHAPAHARRGGGGAARRPLVTIVEIKTCRDTDGSRQRDRADAQHALLRDLLARRNEVRQTTILIGVGGAVPREARDQLQQLGVGRQQAEAALVAASLYMINQIPRLMKARREMEAKARRAQGMGRLRHLRSKGGNRCKRPAWLRRRCDSGNGRAADLLKGGQLKRKSGDLPANRGRKRPKLGVG